MLVDFTPNGEENTIARIGILLLDFQGNKGVLFHPSFSEPDMMEVQRQFSLGSLKHLPFSADSMGDCDEKWIFLFNFMRAMHMMVSEEDLVDICPPQWHLELCKVWFASSFISDTASFPLNINQEALSILKFIDPESSSHVKIHRPGSVIAKRPRPSSSGSEPSSSRTHETIERTSRLPPTVKIPSTGSDAPQITDRARRIQTREDFGLKSMPSAFFARLSREGALHLSFCHRMGCNQPAAVICRECPEALLCPKCDRDLHCLTGLLHNRSAEQVGSEGAICKRPLSHHDFLGSVVDELPRFHSSSHSSTFSPSCGQRVLYNVEHIPQTLPCGNCPFCNSKLLLDGASNLSKKDPTYVLTRNGLFDVKIRSVSCPWSGSDTAPTPHCCLVKNLDPTLLHSFPTSSEISDHSESPGLLESSDREWIVLTHPAYFHGISGVDTGHILYFIERSLLDDDRRRTLGSPHHSVTALKSVLDQLNRDYGRPYQLNSDIFQRALIDFGNEEHQVENLYGITHFQCMSRGPAFSVPETHMAFDGNLKLKGKDTPNKGASAFSDQLDELITPPSKYEEIQKKIGACKKGAKSSTSENSSDHPGACGPTVQSCTALVSGKIAGFDAGGMEMGTCSHLFVQKAINIAGNETLDTATALMLFGGAFSPPLNYRFGYKDNCCRISTSWAAHWTALYRASGVVVPGASLVKPIVFGGQMHAHSHSVACSVLNNALYSDIQVGFVGGESVEFTNSEVRDRVEVIKALQPGHRIDELTRFLGLKNKLRQEKFAAILGKDFSRLIAVYNKARMGVAQSFRQLTGLDYDSSVPARAQMDTLVASVKQKAQALDEGLVPLPIQDSLTPSQEYFQRNALVELRTKLETEYPSMKADSNISQQNRVKSNLFRGSVSLADLKRGAKSSYDAASNDLKHLFAEEMAAKTKEQLKNFLEIRRQEVHISLSHKLQKISALLEKLNDKALTDPQRKSSKKTLNKVARTKVDDIDTFNLIQYYLDGETTINENRIKTDQAYVKSMNADQIPDLPLNRPISSVVISSSSVEENISFVQMKSLTDLHLKLRKIPIRLAEILTEYELAREQCDWKASLLLEDVARLSKDFSVDCPHSPPCHAFSRLSCVGRVSRFASSFGLSSRFGFHLACTKMNGFDYFSRLSRTFVSSTSNPLFKHTLSLPNVEEPLRPSVRPVGELLPTLDARFYIPEQQIEILDPPTEEDDEDDEDDEYTEDDGSDVEDVEDDDDDVEDDDDEEEEEEEEEAEYYSSDDGESVSSNCQHYHIDSIENESQENLFFEAPFSLKTSRTEDAYSVPSSKRICTSELESSDY